MVFKDDCTGKDDNELVALSIKDSRYFYCLMKRYEDKLMAYVYRLTFLQPDDAADVVQIAFIKAYQHLNDCDCDLRFSTWMYRIVHNEAVNFLKKNKMQLKVAIDEESDEFVDWLTADTDIEKETWESERTECLAKVLDNLRPEYKEVLVLRFMEEKDYQEISDILQKPMGTVATLLSRAKKQFKEVYEKNKNCQ